MVAQHVRDLFTNAAERPSEERLERIGYLEPWIFEYKFRDIFKNLWHTRYALMKWRIKVPKS